VEKPLGDPQRYLPMSPLYVPFKILDRLICARVEQIIAPLLPREHVGFLHGDSPGYRVCFLTQDIDDSIAAEKAGAAFVDLTAV